MPPANIRPLMDRTREAMCAKIASLCGFQSKSILDLFAGSGSFSIEAISRGANFCMLCEKTKRIVQHLYYALPPLLPVAHTMRIKHISAARYLTTTHSAYDIIFIDPPFAYAHYSALLTTLLASTALKANGLIVIHHAAQTALRAHAALAPIGQQSFGNARVTFLTVKQ